MLLVFFFRYFLHYSFLRPSVDISFECIIAAVIAIAMLVDFWIVFPFVHERLPTYMFMVSCLLEASFICAVEYAMTHRFVTGVFNDLIRDFGARAVLLPIYSNIFFRDLALLLFVRLAADNIKLSETKAEDREVGGRAACGAAHGVGDRASQGIAAAENRVPGCGEKCVRGLIRVTATHPFKADVTAVA